MKYNPITNELYLDDGTFIKKLHCPLLKQWDELNGSANAESKICEQCNKAVYDTANLSDTQLQQLINESPQACLKLDIDQNNLTITYQSHEH